MNHRKLQQQHTQEQTTLQPGATTQNAALEFPTADEAIRHDAAQIDLPPAIAERLKHSVEQEPPPAVPWWKRLLGE